MKKTLLSSIIILFISFSVQAQKSFKWDQYGLSFTVPSNFKITTNTAEMFEANNDYIWLSIGVFDHGHESPEVYGKMLGEMANSMGMHDSEIGELALTTLGGAYIEGTVDGVGTILVMLLDTNSNIGMMASIIYSDGQGGTATDIVNSFAIE